MSGSTERARDALDVRLDTLKSLRRQADDHAGLPEAFGERYGNLVDDTLDVSTRMALDVSDRQLSDSMLGIVDLRSEQAASARDAMIVMPYLVTGSSTQFNDWIASLTAQDAAAAKFVASATPSEREAFTKLRAESSPEDTFARSVGSVPDAFPQVSLTPATYYENWRKKQAYLGGAIVGVQHVVDNMAASLESDALHAVLAYGLGVSTLVLLVLVLAWIMIRSVNRSLHSLTEAARDVADVQLPNLVNTLQRGGDPGRTEIHPLTVSSNDEIGELAQRVQHHPRDDGARRRGAGQPAPQGHRRPLREPRPPQPVARRPPALHARRRSRRVPRIPTSSRRCSSSTTSRPACAATPRACSCSRARASRGSGASRSRFSTSSAAPAARSPTSPASASSASTATSPSRATQSPTSTHILAELLENATSFSPPGSPVVVAGMLAERRFVVSITDEGIGMDDARLNGANALLQAPPPPGLSLSRTLGLHVVAHLARRYSIRVQLRRAATGGVTAILALPATVLARIAEPEPPQPAPPQPPMDLVAPMIAAMPSAPELPTEPVSVAPEPVPFGWDPGGAPPPAGPPIVVEGSRPEPMAAAFGEPAFADAGFAEPVVVEPMVAEPMPTEPMPTEPRSVTRGRPRRRRSSRSPSTRPGSRSRSRSIRRPSTRPRFAGFEPVAPEAFESRGPRARAVGLRSQRVRGAVRAARGAGEFPDPVVVVDPVLDDGASTQAVAAAAWPEPEVVPPAFDPDAPAPPAATPAEPFTTGLGQAVFDGGDEDLPRRVPGASPLGTDGDSSSLPKRSPGRHLSHQPAPAPAPGASATTARVRSACTTS